MADKLYMKIPEDPVDLLVKSRWAAERGITLVQRDGRPWPKYPRHCRHGHLIRSTVDEITRKRPGGGVQRYCRVCRNATTRRQRSKNPERHLARKREYNARNRDRVLAQKRAYYQKNKETLKEKARERYWARKQSA